MKTLFHSLLSGGLLCVSLCTASAVTQPGGLLVCVSNERGGTVTLIDGSSQQLVATVPVGKRPRGIHASPDGKTLFVAVSGTPISGPPALDKNGNPILKKGGDDDDDDDSKSDHSADGI